MPNLKFQRFARGYICDFELPIRIAHCKVTILARQHVSGHPGVNAASYLVWYLSVFLHFVGNDASGWNQLIKTGPEDVRIVPGGIAVLDIERLADREAEDVREKHAVLLVELNGIGLRFR